MPGAVNTVTFQINNAGQIAGCYTDAAGATHGYVETHGKFQSLDMPGALATIVTAINNLGAVAGYYFDATGKQRGFVATPH